MREIRPRLHQRARFSVGQVVQHELFQYRGVVIDVDPEFYGSDEWYERVAQSRPPKDQPWYHVLVHDGDSRTYVAERNLAACESLTEIKHPDLEHYFSDFNDGAYRPLRPPN